MPSFKLTKFAGIIPKQQAQNLPQPMAQVALDVDLSHDTLRSWRTDKFISERKGEYLFVDGCCVLTSDNCKASIDRIHTDCEYLIGSGIKDYPVINKKALACNNEWKRLGLPLNLPPIDVYQQAVPMPQGTDYDRQPVEFNLEVRQYYYTLVDSFEFESAPSFPSEPLYFHNDKPATINGLPTTFDGYDIRFIRLYCAVTPYDHGEMIAKGEVVKEDAPFLLVAEVPFGTTTITHEPHIAYGEECLTEEYEPPVDNIRDLQYCGNGQIGGIVGNELWLSEPLLPHAFPESYRYGNFNGNLVRFLCTERTGYILTDARPAIIEMESPCKTQGCRSVNELEETLPIISYQSACLYNGACFYASYDGLVMLNGNTAKIITAELYTTDQWQALKPWTMKGVVHNGYYFGVTESGTIRFNVDAGIYANIPAQGLTTLSIRPTAFYRSNQDRLYFCDENGTFEWNAGTDFKTLEWQCRLNVVPSYTAFTAYKVVQDFVPSHIIHTAYKRHRNEMVGDRIILGDKIVNDSRPHRLKGGYTTLAIDVNIKTQGEIYEYHLASSVAELGGA